MDNSRELIALGEEAKIFARSDLGLYISDRANLEIEQAIEALTNIDPTDTNRIRKYQTIIKMHKTFVQWITDAADTGDIAYSDYINAEE